jgi:midasin (ATPase involved in ribosome maturation)
MAKKIDGLEHFKNSVVKAVSIGAEKDMPVLIVGQTGTGKTMLVRELAKQAKRELIRINLTGQTGVDEILGKWLASPERGTFWIDGLLTRAMREGHWVVLDEINMMLPEITARLHSLMDDDKMIVLTEKDGEIVRPHESFRLFATINPSGEYGGFTEGRRDTTRKDGSTSGLCGKSRGSS